MEIVDEIISLHGGISQQNVTLRLEHQVEDSINCYHTIESGTRRRNPTISLGQATGIDSNCFVYNYDRGLSLDLNEKYSIIYDEQGFRALDINSGTVIPVIDNSGTYMQDFDTETGYSAVTVKDVTFISNRNKTVELLSNTTASQVNEGFIWVKRADPIDGYTYTVTVNGISKTTSGQLTTATVASNIAANINTIGGVGASVSGNIVRIYGAISSIGYSDSYGNQAGSYIYKTVTTEDDLPSSMPYNAVVEVSATNVTNSNYYLKSTSGVWKETLGYGIKYKLNPATMPHKIERKYDVNDNIYFEVNPISWTDREVGDDKSSKIPSFVGSNITDICFYKNRLGFLSPTSVLFSEIGEYYNFWKTTQVAVLEADRIDVELDSKKAIRLHYMDFLQDDLIIFGDKTQFRVTHSGILSSQTISATLISEYAFNPRVRPLAIDNKIVFTALNNNNNAVYMYTKDSSLETNTASSVTQHVPYLLDKDISQVVGSSVNSVLFFRSETEKDVVYVYKYLEDGDKLIQSAWFKWTFTAEIHSIFCTEGRLYLLTSREDVLSDNDWVMYDGVWDDNQEFENAGVWSDNAFLLTDSLEAIDIIPNKIIEDFLDVGNVEYTSILKISEYLPSNSSDKKVISNKINLKTIYVKADNDSIFELDIENIIRGTIRRIDEKYVLGRRPYIMGKASDIRMSITSKGAKGFEINGLAIEAKINNRSKTI